MRRIKVIIFALGLALSGIFGDVVFASTQDFYFEDFTADYYLTKSEDGLSNLHVKEVLTAVFPKANQNHGITRQIPYTNQGGINRTIADKAALNLRVLKNGEPESVDRIVENNGYYIVYIGTASEYVHGKQVYTLEYDYTNVIMDFDENGENVSGRENIVEAFEELYWDTNGTGWKQRFDKVTARLHVPEDVYEKMDDQAWCYVGGYGAKGSDRCTIVPTDDGFDFITEGLEIGENLTFVTKFQPGTFKTVLNKDYTLVYILVAEIALVAILIIWRVAKWLNEAKPKYDMYKKIFVAPQYQPPKDGNIRVAEGEQIYIKKSEPSYVATLLELVVNKKVTIKKIEGEKYDWTVILNVEPEELTGSQKQMMNILSGDGKFKKGDEIPIQKHIATPYLSECAKDYAIDAVQVLKKGGYLVNKGERKKSTNWAVLIPCLTAIIVMMIGFESLGDFISKYAANAEGLVVGREFIPFLVSVIFLATVLVILRIEQQRHKYARHTEEGLKLARYLEGLELYIKMAEADRLKFLQSVGGADTSNSGIVKLYEKLLPWASLFGAEESWVKELEKYYKVEDVNEAISFDVLDGIVAMNMVRDINSAVVASTGYSDSGGGGSSFSSGGGGGGFSGGGGGGGGGGGW